MGSARNNVACLVLVGGLMWSLEQRANACEVLQRDVLPENAAVMLSSDCETAEAVITVDVDGTPAQLIPAGVQEETGYTGYMEIAPKPSAGQQVLISIDAAAFPLTVGEPDNTPPSLEQVELTVEDQPACSICPDSGQDPSGSIASVSWEDPAFDRSTIYVVDLVVDGRDLGPTLVGGTLLSEQAPSGLAQSSSGKVSEACAKVVAFDAAGNRDEFEFTCVESDAQDGCGCTARRGSGWSALALLGLLLMRRKRWELSKR